MKALNVKHMLAIAMLGTWSVTAIAAPTPPLPKSHANQVFVDGGWHGVPRYSLIVLPFKANEQVGTVAELADNISAIRGQRPSLTTLGKKKPIVILTWGPIVPGN